MGPKTIVRILLLLVAEKILQHGLSALLFAVNIDWVGKPDIGSLIPLSDPVMTMLNLIVMGFFIWAFYDIWKLRMRGLNLAIIFSLFDIAAEVAFHGIGFITVSVIVAIFIVGLAYYLRRRSSLFRRANASA
jgi:hypothetical protein